MAESPGTAFSDAFNKVLPDVESKRAYFARWDAEIEHFNGVWAQDAGRIGRVLRAHLAVEYFLTKYLSAAAPALGDIDGARLGFLQKIDLISNRSRVAYLKPGLRRLNEVRNRLAHRLEVDVNQDDRNAFLSLAMFAAMRAARSKYISEPESDEPLSVLEQFSHHASLMLDNASKPPDEVMAEILRIVSETTSKEASTSAFASDQHDSEG